MRRGSAWARKVYGEGRQYKQQQRTKRGIERSLAAKEENRRREEEALREEQRKRHCEWVAEASFRRYVSYMKCFWCGLPYGKGMASRTREHLVPRSLGGDDVSYNLMYSHKMCNERRGSNMNWIPWYIHKQDGKVMWK